jgi:hypothetical protein
MSANTESETKIVALKLSDGSLVELSEGMSGPDSDRIEEVFIPVSVPWEDDVQCMPAHLEFAGSEERQMGGETVWSAKYWGATPNGTTEFTVEALFMEYAHNFQLTDINTDDAVSFAHFDSGDLVPYIRATQ